MSRSLKWVRRGLLWLTRWKLNVSDHNAMQAEPLWASQLSVPHNIDKDITQPDAQDDDYIYWSN